MRASNLFAFVLLVACGDSGIKPEGGGGSGNTGGSGQGANGTGGVGSTGGSEPTNGGGGAGGGTTNVGGGSPCPAGATCVTTFPFTDTADTSAEGTDVIASYDCAPDTNEGGPELLYRVTIPSDGFLSAAVHDGDGVDIDVHIVPSLDPAAPSGAGCVARGDLHAKADVTAGEYWVVADTWTNGAGAEQSGAFTIDIGFIPVPEGPCAMQTGEMPRVGDDGDHLAMPATGPVVIEAHLVTQAEPAPYPSTATEELAAHYTLSQNQTGLVMFRDQVWAPLEGGDFYGAGIGDPARFPVVDEGWYVNMYWTPAGRPPRGTKMILRHPEDPTRAVVVAAGYETGPGNLANIAGTTEETHFYLGTGHESPLKLGIAVDQSLDFGPRRCTD